MKKVLSVLLLAVGFIACEKETIIVIEDNPCEDCVGATVSLAAQARGPVDRDQMYAWIDVITIEAIVNSVDYGDEFELVDDGSGADGFYLETIPVRETADFSASSTSKDDGAGEFLVEATNPDNLDDFVDRMPYAEYATDAPVSQYIENGDNLVYLNMYTNHGRLISSFQLANNLQNGYNLIVTKDGNNVATTSGTNGIVSYYNDATSLEGVSQTFNLQVVDQVTNQVVFTRSIVESIVASTSITSKYVVGLGFVEDTTTEVIFIWQPWVEDDGTDETDATSPNGLDCASCGTVTNQNVSGSYALTQDTVLEDVNLVISGDLNLNGHTLTVSCGDVTVSGNFNGGGTLIAAGNLIVTGATQNNPTILVNECY